MIRFCTFVLLQVMDAAYVCYVIDLDNKSCNSQIVHRVFGGEREVLYAMKNVDANK
jgi:hypothetical protein